MFRRVATHPATEEALVGAHRELSDLDDAALVVLAAPERPRARGRAHPSPRESAISRAGWYDEHDLMRAAHELVEAGAPLLARARHGRVPSPAARVGAERAAAARGRRAQRPRRDRRPHRRAPRPTPRSSRASRGSAATSTPTMRSRSSPAHGTAVCSISDADDEVRVVVRGIVDAMREGVPLERMAVLVRQHRAVRALAARAPRAGRHRAQRRVGAHARRFRARPRVAAHARAARRRLPPRRRVRVARERSGARRSRPARCRRSSGSGSRATPVWSAGSPSGARGSSTTSRRWHEPATRQSSVAPRTAGDRARALARFVEELAADLAAAPRTWSALAEWAHGLIRRWVGAEAAACAAGRRSSRRPRAGSRPRSTGSAVSTRSRRARRSRCSADRWRSSSMPRAIASGRLGEGVLVGSAALALGVEFDRAVGVRARRRCVPGAAARRSAARRRRSRRAGGRAAEARRSRRRRSARAARRARRAPPARASCASRAAISGAAPSTCRRGSCSTRSKRSPGRVPLGAELPDGAVVHGGPVVRARAHARVVPADPARARRARRAGRRSADRRGPRGRARARAGARAAQRRVHPLRRQPHAPRRAAGRAQPDRARTSRCRRPGSRRGRSARTRTSCSYLLHVAADRAARGDRAAHADRPRQRRARGARALPRASCIGVAGVGRPWSRRAPGPAARDPRRGVRRGRSARRDRPPPAVGAVAPPAARAARRVPRLRQRLPRRARRRDDRDRARRSVGRRRRTRAIEIKCSDGRTVRIIGSIDRVDRFADGRLAVIDYKSGSASGVHASSRTTIRCSAARCSSSRSTRTRRASLLGDAGDEPVDASYWFVLRDPKKPRGYLVDAPVEDALDRALRVIVDGIDGGMFVARPPEPGWQMFVECPYCDPDGLGTTDTHRGWLRKLAAPELADYLELIGSGAVSTGRRPASIDDAARDAVRTRLDETLFVEAGAGTGKTTVLVERIVELVTADGPGLPVPMRCVAAITFTEKAAAELRDRVRGELETRASRAESRRPTVRDRCTAGARRSRRRRDLHAALVRAADPHRVPGRGRPAAAHRGARRSVVVARRSTSAGARPATTCSTIPSSSRRCSSCSRPGATPEHLRRVAEYLDDNWDLLDRIGAVARAARARARRRGSPSSTRCARRAITAPTPTTSCSRTSASSRSSAPACAARSTTPRASSCCSPTSRRSRPSVGRRRELARRQRRARPRVAELGEQNAPRSAPRSPTPRCAASSSSSRCAPPSTRPTAGSAGELEFHDLLVLARARAARPGARPRRARAGCATATSGCSSTSSRTPTRSRSRSPRCSRARRDQEPSPTTGEDIEVAPGRLFFVGDPKQSIYRFRRADIATFLAARDRFADDAACGSRRNFRSTEPVLDVDQPRVRPS